MTLHDRIELRPTSSDVTRLNTWLDERLARSGIDGSIAADLKLCLNEVLANLISHGFDKTPDPTASVEIELQPGRARATVTDNGAYFDMRAWEAPGDPSAAEHGGFGIALIKERASRISYARAGGLNELTIVCEGATPCSEPRGR